MSEQELLLHMATRSGDRLTVADLRTALRDVPNVNELLRRLVSRGLLYRPTRGTYRFALPLFGSYLRRHRKITKVTRSVISGSPSSRHGAAVAKQRS
jgi:predicted transcriptional regulator of viral defense system